ncbi:MAG: hypothetical protein AB8G22_28225, partial [Saprospiraceae bacterium]
MSFVDKLFQVYQSNLSTQLQEASGVFFLPLNAEYATSATGAVRNGAAANATGAPDGVTTEVGSSSDYLVLTLANEISAGTEYTIYISGRGG